MSVGDRFPQGSRARFEDMLALLAPTKSGDGGAAEVEATPPNTRGTRESTADVGQRQAPPVDPRQRELADARAACAAGSPTQGQLALIRATLRVPWTLTHAQPCEDLTRPCCSTPRHYLATRVADSICELDGTCWIAEREAHDEFRSLHGGRSATREDARYRRGIPVGEPLPIEQLAAVNAPEAPAPIAGLREPAGAGDRR